MRVAATLFVASLCLIEWQNGDRFQLTLDEGIYLDGASRVARGQAPYRDFFTFTGPGTFWTYGAVFHLFGATLSNARLVLSAEIALMTAGIYWVGALLTDGLFAAALGGLFAAFCLDSTANLYISHRWDSNTWAFLALALACCGKSKLNRVYWIAAGTCLGIAAWMTPPFVIVVAFMAAWMAWTGGFPRILNFLAGVAAPSLVAIGVLSCQGALGPMIQQLSWATSHYSGPNRVAYGYLIERAEFPGAIKALAPAFLPALAFLGLTALWFARCKQLQQDKDALTLLVAFAAAVLLAGLPRLGAHQLLFVSPVFFVLCGYVLFTAAGQFRRWLWPGLAAVAVLMLASSIATDRRYTDTVETNAGPVRCEPADAKLLAALGNAINPGDTLFVFPYLPVVYFLSGGEDPSRYSFLQPGMMTEQDEIAVEQELGARPPRWMLWADFPDRFWLDIWPHTDRRKLRLPKIENYMSANYRETLRIKMSGQQTLVLGSRDSAYSR